MMMMMMMMMMYLQFSFKVEGDDESMLSITPKKKLRCPLKRDHVQRNFHLPTVNWFKGDMLVFRGISFWCASPRDSREAFFAPKRQGSTTTVEKHQN